MWVLGLLNKLTALKFPSHMVKTIFHCRTFQTFLKLATSTRRGTRAGAAHGGLVIPLLFRLYVNDTPATSSHGELAQYADDTALADTTRSPSLIVCYLSSVLFVNTTRCIQMPRRVQFLGELIHCFETALYVAVNLDTRLTWMAHVSPGTKKSSWKIGSARPRP